MSNRLFNLIVIALIAIPGLAAEMGVPVQLRLKSPLGVYPTDSGLEFKIQILSPSGGCVLREEVFSSQSIADGNISLALGSGTRGPLDPNISLITVYDNVSSKSGLSCVDSNNNVISSGQTYSPAAGDARIMRVISDISGDHIVADFNMRAAPYALVAESVGGKVGADILVQDTGTVLNQANLADLLADATRFTKLKNLAVSGIADNATNATNATNAVNAQTAVDFSGSLAGDVTGVQSSTVVAKLRGITISTAAPVSGQVLAYDGSQYVPVTPPAGTVTSVNGQTGAVVLNASHIAGVVTSATSLIGDVTGNVSATVVSSVGGKTAAQVATAVNEVNSATALAATANTLVKRDGSGNIVASNVLATSNSTQNVYIYETTNTNSVRLKAPNSFANYILTLPTTDGNSGEVLQTDGSGNLSWVGQSGAVTSSTIVSALGYTPADDSLVMKKSNNLGDLVSATAARINLGLGGAAILNVGTTAGTVAAGDDSRITSALQQSDYNADVAGATCSSGQSMYWNSVSSQFACQDIQVSGDISGIASSVTVTKIQGTGVSFSSIASNHILQYNGSNIVNRAIPTCSANQYLTFNGSAWSCASDVGAGGIVSSIAVVAPLQSTGGSTPTLSMPQATGSVSGYLSGADWATFNNKIASSAASVAQVLGFSPANSSSVLLISNNLSDLSSSATARSNLGLAGAAILNVGTTAGTVAAGDDSRLVNALQTTTNFGGDVSGTYDNVTVTKIQNQNISATVPVEGQALVYNGSEWVPTTGMPRYSRVTSNYTNSTTTYTSIDGLSFPVVTGKVYKFRFNVIFSVASTTRALRLLLGTPSVTTLAAQIVIPTSTTVAGSYVVATQSGTVTGGTNATSGQILFSTVEGIIVPSATGTFQLQASNSGGGSTSTVYSGSTVEFVEVP